MTLSSIQTGDWAIITALLNNEYMLKLIEMGFYENKTIQVLSKTWDRETLSVKLGHSRIMLRKQEADTIMVRKCEEKF